MSTRSLLCDVCSTPLPSATTGCPRCVTQELTVPAGSTLTPHPISGALPPGNGEDVDDPVLGLTLGGCLLEAKIGQGGMGSVYRARHSGLDRDVVVKILPPAYTSTKEFRDRFIREAQAAAKLSHPNVVHVYDVGYDQGLLFYVMEWVDGQSLEEICLEGPLAPREAVRVILEAAKGLGAAHAAGIIHRDIKAANILRCPQGGVKVTDFGVARDMTKERISASGTLLGTPHYMAPEQAEGHADERSDLYSLGVTLFQLLTCKLPFDGTSYLSLIRQHQKKPPPSPREFAAGTPASVCAVVERLLKKKPSRRYQDVDSLLVDLERITIELASAEALPSKRSRQPLGLLALVTLAALFAIVATRWLPEDLGGQAAGQSGADPSGVTSKTRPPPDDEPGGAVDPVPDDLSPAPLILALETPKAALVFGTAPPTFVARLTGPAPKGLIVLANGAPVEIKGERLEISVPGLEEGRHTVHISARVGGEEKASLDVEITVDTTSPQISILEPAEDQVYRVADLDPRRLWVKLKVEDATDTRVTARIEQPQGTGRVPPPIPLEGGQGSAHGGWIPLRPQGEPARTFVGHVTLVLRAEDRAGNAVERETQVVLVPYGMTLVPGGLFRTGSNEPGTSSPPREFSTSNPFFIDTHEVTNAAYQPFVNAGGGERPRSRTWSDDHYIEGTGPLPVQGVGYVQAQSFARWRGRRLPTEVEWEKAAGWNEARQRSQRYPWGDDGEANDANTADYWMRRGTEARPLPVGSIERDRSPSGCFDMAGNVQEWATLNAAPGAKRQVLKGGCYLNRLAAAARFRREVRDAVTTLEQFGFRCVRDLTPGDEADP